MGVVGRLDQYASMLAGEFDDYSMSENLLTYSEQFNNAVWSKSFSSITQNSVVAPDGLSTADTLIENTLNGAHSITQSVTKPTSAITYTLSAFAKLRDTRNIQFTLSAADFSGIVAVVVNLSTGVISSGPTTNGTFSNTSAKVQSYPNGWYRIALTTTSNTVTPISAYIYTVNGTSNSYIGDGTSGIYIWGAQLETGSVATDYTPTTTTAKNRVLSSTTNTNITGLSTYFGSGFSENVGAASTLVANVFPPYDPVYDDFGGTLFGAGQGRYMRQNTDKSVIVYNEIDEVTDFRDIVRTGLVLDLDAAQPLSYKGTGEIWYDLSGNGNNATRTNNGGYGGQVTYNSSGFFDFSMNSPSVTAGASAGNGFLMSSMIIPAIGSFTLNAFIRRNLTVKAAGDRETIFSNTGDAEGWRFGIGAGGDIYYLISGAGGAGYQEGGLGGSTLNNGNWHMMTAVFDRAAQLGSYTVYGYIDGVASGSVAIAAGAAVNTAFVTRIPGVGYGGCCDVFAGQIANVFAYNRALTSTEITKNYNALKHRFGL